jgi:formylglycine-generating enzyme required for sulfatase activity
MWAQVRPHVLGAAAERALKPGDSFKECAEDCPEMVVIPAGEFMMGSPASEQGRNDDEEPQHRVVFAKPLAVAKFDVTFDDWDACVAYGDCDPGVSDGGYGRGRQPGHQRHVGCPAVCSMAVADDRQAVPAVVRGRVRIRGARRNADRISVG